MNNSLEKTKDEFVSIVEIGDNITVVIDNFEETYTISFGLSDPEKGVISKNSPLALILLGRKKEDKFEYTVIYKRESIITKGYIKKNN
jgi:transcription elongation GreA/GreB family factor